MQYLHKEMSFWRHSDHQFAKGLSLFVLTILWIWNSKAVFRFVFSSLLISSFLCRIWNLRQLIVTVKTPSSCIVFPLLVRDRCWDWWGPTALARAQRSRSWPVREMMDLIELIGLIGLIWFYVMDVID
jgi:hypothetical protein